MKPNWKTLFLLTTCCTLGLITSVRAQVSSDGTLSTTVSNPDNLNFTINNGNRVGGNLFHSFREFSVPNGGSAVFQNPLDVQNIISRVTGGSLSQINGLIQAQGSANLFLLNPAGISFGQNARLSIGGSFFATTADSLLFGDGIEFSATNPQAPLLTVNIPIGLRFRDNPGNITNQSVVQDNTGFGIGLQVNPGNSLALVGGNVSLEQGGRLTAAGGRIELGGLTGAGTVGLDTTGNTFRLNFPTNGLSNVSLADDARVAVRSNGGGDIAVNANIFTATNGGRLVGGIEGIATRKGGDITVNSNEFNISGVGQSGIGAGISQQVIGDTSGNAGGNININTKSFNASSGGQLQNSVLSTGIGNAGNVTINVPTGIVRIAGRNSDGSRSGIFNDVESGARGNGGNIIINAGSIFTDDAELRTANLGDGSAGSITLNARDEASITNSTNFFSNVTQNGQAGDISIKAGSFSLLGGSQLQSSVLEGGQGNAGNVTLRTENGDISLAGGSGIFSTVESGGTGNAGAIDVTTRNLTLTDGSQLLTSVRPRQQGNTGNKGNAGNITVQASGTVRIAGRDSSQENLNPSGIFSTLGSGASGNAGNIIINAGSIFTDDASLRTTNAGTGSAGSITLNASDQVSILNSRIFSEGSFGRIFIGQSSTTSSPPVIPNSININNSTLSTTNSDTTFAGDIALNARDQVSLNQSMIESNGNRGRIFIGKNDIYGDGTSSPRVVRLEGSSLSTTNQSITGADDTPFNSGNISIDAIDSISLNNQSLIQASTWRTGNAGNVTLRAENGDISLAGGSVIFSTVESGRTGNAGKIDVTTRNLTLTDGSQLQTVVRAKQQGNAGDITVQASGNVSFSGFNNIDPGGNSSLFRSGIFSEVQSDAIGNAGNILINAASIFLDNGARLRTTNAGDGFAGEITLNARDQVSILNSKVISEGDLGFIFIGRQSNTTNTPSVIPNRINIDNSTLSATNSSSSGIAGDITLNARDQVSITNNSIISSEGNFGRIFIGRQSNTTNTPSVIPNSINIANSRLSTSNLNSTEITGNIALNASDKVSITNSTISSEGSSGRIFIGQSNTKDAPPVTPNTINIDNSILSTTNSNTDIAGDIALNARDQISLDRRSIIQSNGNRGRIFIGKNDIYGDGISSPRVVSFNNYSPLITTNGSVTGALNTPINSGDISIDALDSIFLGNGSEVAAFSLRPGNAGNVTIRSGNSVTLSGVAPTVLQDGRAGGFSSGLFSSSEDADSGPGGQIWVETPNLRILDGAVISTRSRSAANAGNITVKSRNVELRGGGQILATAFNGGNAGNIDVTANRITISGTDPTLNTRFNQVAQRFGESEARQRIDPVFDENGTLVNNSGIFVNSTGTGQSGNLSITGNTLTLDRGIISASTASSDGGNINLRLRNFVRLQNESLISAEARGQQGGDGGNITIDTPFIVAFPQNNDIIANAVSGNGGRVTTNATLFGIIPRTRADLEKLGVPGLNPRNLSTSDITAFSEQNSSFGDNVQVTSPDVDPSRGLVELPETVSDPTQKIAQNPCQQGVGNEFTITGRGGLPTTPNETLNSDNVRIDLLQPVASSGNSRSATKTKPATTVTATRVPAQGWIFNDKGQVVLTAYDPTNTGSQRSFRTAAACPAR